MRCEKCPSDERTDKTVHIGKLIHELDNILYRNMLAIGKRYDYDQLTVMNGWILRYLSMNEGKEVFQKSLPKTTSNFGSGIMIWKIICFH